MFHIFLLGYIYVVLLFSLAQNSFARGVVYFVCFAGAPVLLILWARGQRSRNRRTKNESEEVAHDLEDVDEAENHL